MDLKSQNVFVESKSINFTKKFYYVKASTSEKLNKNKLQQDKSASIISNFYKNLNENDLKKKLKYDKKLFSSSCSLSNSSSSSISPSSTISQTSSTLLTNNLDIIRDKIKHAENSKTKSSENNQLSLSFKENDSKNFNKLKLSNENISKNWVFKKSSDGLYQLKKSIKCLKKLGNSSQQLNVTSDICQEFKKTTPVYRSKIENFNLLNSESQNDIYQKTTLERKTDFLNISCPLLTDQLLFDTIKTSNYSKKTKKEIKENKNDHLAKLSEKNKSSLKKVYQKQLLNNTRNSVNQKCMLKCCKKKKQCGFNNKKMSQAKSSVDVKNQSKNGKEQEINSLLPKNTSLSSSDANNNNTGSVKILVNDLTTSNSHELLILQQRQSCPIKILHYCLSHNTSPLFKRKFIQLSRSTSDLSEKYCKQHFLTKEQFILSNKQPIINSRDQETSNFSSCRHSSSFQLNRNKSHSWSYFFDTNSIDSNLSFISLEKNKKIEIINQVNNHLEECSKQRKFSNDVEQKNQIQKNSKQFNEFEEEIFTNVNLQLNKDCKHDNFVDNFFETDSSLKAINEQKNFSKQLIDNDYDQNRLNKPRSLSASSCDAFYHNLMLRNQLLKNHNLFCNNQLHFLKPTKSSLKQYQNKCCCFTNDLDNFNLNTYSMSNSGSSSHESISVSQMSISTNTPVIDSTGSNLQISPNFGSNFIDKKQQNDSNQSNLSISSTNSFQIFSKTDNKSNGKLRSKSATDCLSTNDSNQSIDQISINLSISNLNKNSTLKENNSSSRSLKKQSIKIKNEKQINSENDNINVNVNAKKIDNENKSTRNRNLILQHQLHKSISTPTLVVNEEPTANLINERSSALSRIKNKLTGNNNSNMSALKVGTSILFSTVRDKLRNENLALTCAPESDDERSNKPKKRASLFFRKKKNKDIPRKSAHQFVSVSFSTAALCDVCRKPLANKLAIKCESCLITIHDNSCKDQILDCNKFRLAKKPNLLTLQVPGSTGNFNSFGINSASSNSPTLSTQNFVQQSNTLNSCSTYNTAISNTLSQSVSNSINIGLLPTYLSQSSIKQSLGSNSSEYQTPVSNLSPTISLSSSYLQLHPSNTTNLNSAISTSSFRKGHHPSASIGSFSSLDSSCSLQSKINTSSPSYNRKSYTPSAYSQWRRVATKLGVNKVICEDKEAENNEDNSAIIVETNSTSLESLEDADHLAYSSFINLLDDDHLLKLSEEEPAAWSSTVQPNLLKTMKEKEIKLQEAIYELILTEKHHCLTMKIMQKIFSEGMIREVGLPKDDVDRIFPCLEPLLDLHLAFLRRLRERQAKLEIIPNISDLLLSWFSGKNAEKLRNYYGEFCSQHKEAVFLYKDYLKTDRKFQSFIKNCLVKPYCKTRGIPECILLVTQRVTKYPLLIESLLKLNKELSKQLSLQLNQDEAKRKTEKQLKIEIKELEQCLVNVRQIIFNVDFQVAEKEREIRLLKIYNKIDPKSTAYVNGKKFRKSDLLSDKRKLQYETLCTYRNSHSKQAKSIDCMLIILSDILVFLQENNQKYYFAPIDNKSSVISLQKLIVREKAGQSSKGIFLISTNINKEEMYELHFATIKDQKALIGQLNYTIALSQFEAENSNNETALTDNALMAWRLGISSPVCRPSTRRLELNELINELHFKDKQIATICEEKIHLIADLLEQQGILSTDETNANYGDTLHLISYSNFLNDACSQETLLSAANEACRIVQSLYLSGSNLSRSVSSAGEHQSDQFINPPILPKRAETFGGFDNSAENLARFLKRFTISNNIKDSKNLIPSNLNQTDLITEKNAYKETSNILSQSIDSNNQNLNSSLNFNDNQVKIEFSMKSETIEDKKIQDSLINEKDSLATSIKDSNSPTILINTVLPMQDPNDISQLSTILLLLKQLENNKNEADSNNKANSNQSKNEQVIQIVELQHQLNLLLCLFHHQQTLFELMRLHLQDAYNNPSNIVNSTNQASNTGSNLTLNFLSANRNVSLSPPNQISSTSISNALSTLPITSTNSLSKKFCPESQLEELRNLHEQFIAEKQLFSKQLNQHLIDFRLRTEQLDKREEQLKKEKLDLIEQREFLFRKLENLQDELGICMLGSSSGLPTAAKLASLQASIASNKKNSGTHNIENELSILKSTIQQLQQQIIKSDQNEKSLINSQNFNIGLTNKLYEDCQIKQQIPLKLAINNLNNSKILPSTSKNDCKIKNDSPKKNLLIKKETKNQSPVNEDSKNEEILFKI